jgi:predicted glycosyltransferase
MSRRARILMYSQDSLGLGHLRRLTNLAEALVARRSDLAILLVVDSPVAPFFELRPGIDFVKLPTVVKVDAGVFRAGRMQVPYDEVRALRSCLLRNIALRFAPDLLLVDHMPGGANRELLPALQAIDRRAQPTRVVLGLRDIIDRPDVTCEVWRREGAYEAMERHYDRVLVYGARDVFATADEYGIAERMGDRVRYCGYVCNMAAVEEPRRVRERLGLGDEPIVAAMAGGGADGLPLMSTLLEAARLLGPRRPFATLMVTGPFLAEAERTALRERAGACGVRVLTTVGDSLSHMHAADVVVSMGGYNTMSEILRLARRAIVVPRAGPSAEQSMRARLFAQRGLVDVLAASELAPATLALAIERALSEPGPQRPRLVPDLDGVANAATALIEELDAVGAARGPVPRAARRGPRAPALPGARPGAAGQ